MRAMTTRKVAGRVGVGLVALILLAQLVPYGRSHANPPVTRSPKWDSAQTAKLVNGACMDCHSNLTNWRWYSNIAPGSWLIQRDVDGGRRKLNFSRWDQHQPRVEEVLRVIRRGGMPPLQYKIVHPAARLSKADQEKLARGIEATYKADPPPSGD
jgi:mono/diheme cytochrome c family protein